MSVKIIAEVAQGFEGNVLLGELLIKAAVVSGADAVKFQLVFADEIAEKSYIHYELFKSLELSNEVWQNLASFSKSKNIELHLDIFGEKSLKLAQHIGVQTIKLHPTDITNLTLLNQVAISSIKNVVLGVGGAYLDEIEHAIKILQSKNIVIMSGFQSYPTETADIQLSRIRYLKDYFYSKNQACLFGYADHGNPEKNESFVVPAVAVGLGVTYIEKHICLSREMKFEDYESAANVEEFSKFVALMHSAEHAIGKVAQKNDFGMSVSELGYREKILRHVVAVDSMVKGEIIAHDKVALKRTNETDPIFYLKEVYGKKINCSISKGQAIRLKDLL